MGDITPRGHRHYWCELRTDSRRQPLPETVRLIVSQRPVHDVQANVSVYRVTKRFRNRGKDLKAERAPQPDRRRAGFDNRAELHRPIAVRPGLVQDMVAQSTAHTLTAPCRMDDKPGIRNVGPRASVDGMSVCAPDDASTAIEGDKSPPGSLSHPPSAGARFGSCRIPRQRLPGGALLFQDQPDSRPVLCLRLTYHHEASIATCTQLPPFDYLAVDDRVPDAADPWSRRRSLTVRRVSGS
jgi:hypothetical protein